MSVPDDVVRASLERLLVVCRDGAQGFRAAADNVKDLELRDLFARWSQQRAQFAAALQAEIERLGGEPATGGSVAGALHRGWMDLRSTVRPADERAILAEAERGEQAAVAAYEAALRQGLPVSVRGLVEQQFTMIKDAGNAIRGMLAGGGGMALRPPC